MKKNEVLSLLHTLPLTLIGIFFFIMPLLYSTATTEAFLLPKQLFLSGVVMISLLILGIQMIFEGKVRLWVTPFDKPVLLFAIVSCISALLSVNRFDSMISYIPVLHAILLYFLIVNVTKGQRSLLFLLASLVAGATLSALISVFGFFKIYPLPFAYAKSPYFSTMGTLFDQALYLAFVLPIAGYFAFLLVSTMNKKSMQRENEAQSTRTLLFTVASIIIGTGLLITLYHLLTSQKPLLLPLASGFQIAFATISQDAGRMMQSFLVGSGIGTFLSDFTRFKQAAYNSNATLWSVSFLRSSSFVLELLATTGVLGLAAYLLIIFVFIKQRVLFLPLVLAFAASLLFPFSTLLIMLLFSLLGIFAASQAQNNAKGYGAVEMHLLTTKEDIFAHNPVTTRYGRLMPTIVFVLLAAAIGFISYNTVRFAVSDVLFQKSLIAASQNNGSQTYKLQAEAIQQFPYRDTYQRVFSQTNLALANSLARQAQKEKADAETQKNILTLIQQSITTARAATALAPYTATNWNNLSSIYRSLIGFGKNAEQFAIVTNQQAIALDANNPQQYIALGGIYYQLKQWDEASRQFQLAVALKNDHANAYYNLAHTLESRGDLAQAYKAYQIVKQLAKDSQSQTQLDEEMKALEAKIAANPQPKQAVAPAATGPQTQTDKKEQLSVNQSAAQLPTQTPQQPIEGPSITPPAQ